jgi:high affinity Mn2+ porin
MTGDGAGVRTVLVGAVLGIALLTAERGLAADATMPTKAPPPPATPAAYDWTGFYFGGHMGYALGASNWSSTPGQNGTLDFSNAYNFKTGNGSYQVGLQGGYDYMTASRWLLGVEVDFSAPSFVGGNQTFSSVPTGTANYLETVEFSGNVLGRIGYAPSSGSFGHWLFYATGGFAWSYDQFTRIQLAGVPAGGAAVPGTVENAFIRPRVGGAVGAGAEVALDAHWTAQLQYLFTDYGSRSVTFPAGAQRFASSLELNQVRLGLNYRFGGNDLPELTAKGPPGLDLEWFAFHGQTTFTEQYALPFHSPYSGKNSLPSNSGREAWETTFTAGFKLWQGAEFWIDPDILQGFGLGNTTGVAGFVNGSAAKVGSSPPYARIPKAFVRQTVDLGGDSEKVEAYQNQFAGSQTANRLVFTIGKFAVSDVFDTNRYAHDPHKDFLNWALSDTGSFDFAGDSWGYTYGAAAEWYQGDWTLRGGLFALSVAPNSPDLDTSFGQFQWVGEVERRWELGSHPGKIAFTGFLSRGSMGSFQDAVQLAQSTGEPADTSAVRQYRGRGGISMNLEQEVTSDLGVFMRAGASDGSIEPFDFTDIDRTVAAGLQLTGKQWGRPDDTFGVAGVVNGLTKVHQEFLNNGGIGIEVGDGMLPHPGLEQIIEAYYAFPIVASSSTMTLDYQFIANPAYNRDRGPVSVIGARWHAEF